MQDKILIVDDDDLVLACFERLLGRHFNVETAVDQLRSSGPVLHEAVAKGQLRVVGAVCSLENGEVRWLPH